MRREGRSRANKRDESDHIDHSEYILDQGLCSIRVYCDDCKRPTA
jgi:hypothetical protein